MIRSLALMKFRPSSLVPRDDIRRDITSFRPSKHLDFRNEMFCIFNITDLFLDYMFYNYYHHKNDVV
jgi:hypothetical protein